IHWLTSRTFPTLTAQIEVGGERITLVNSHPVPPGSLDAWIHRNRELGRLPELLPSEGLVVVGGDFNTTMWSPFFRDLLPANGLSEARQGYGVVPTWPVPLRPFMIPLDHILISSEISVESFATHRDHSDHAMLFVQLALPMAP